MEDRLPPFFCSFALKNPFALPPFSKTGATVRLQASQPHVLIDTRMAVGGIGAAYPGGKANKGKLGFLVWKNRDESRVQWRWDDVRVIKGCGEQVGLE